MPPPRAITCDLCGKQFFPASMKFHQKACAIRRANLEFPCSYCDRPFKKVDLDEHEKRCRKRPRGIRNSSKVEAKEKRAEARSKVAAYLRPCAVCGRTFSEDRIATHQKICRKVKKVRLVDVVMA